MIYVLTEEYNDYNQYGEYFVHAWTFKPTRAQLAKELEVGYRVDFLDHILNGGGRTEELENHWYNMRVVL